MKPVLILFDVDGTLLVTGGASSRCIRRACRQVLGSACADGQLTVGTLDPQLFMEMARQCGVVDAEQHLPAYQAIYLRELEAELIRSHDAVKLMPGVHAALAELSGRTEVTIGLLTGNWRRSVELKFSAAGLSIDIFAVGAFAEDGNIRADLVPAALRHYRQKAQKELSPGQVILVGDTPRDIECARQAGCRVLAVATGHYSLEKLQGLNPDEAAVDLTELAPLDRLIAHIQHAV